MQCSSYSSRTIQANLPPSSDLHEAVSIIEREASLQQLNRSLIGHLKTFNRCHSCNSEPESLVSVTKRIHIFKACERDLYMAYPIIVPDDLSNNVNKICSNCQFSSKNVEMEVSKQIFVQLPQCLIVSVNCSRCFRFDKSYDKIFPFSIVVGTILTRSFFLVVTIS